ncbi:MAG: tyrosine-type recombinase/integrase [Actinophytocola sp.]|nr:tyrosine-type recombinase/integrase [Actinophytocola sp.]
MARLRKRQRGTIERRGNSLRVKVYAGTDPLTGKRLYLRESTTDEKEAERILTRLLAQVDANTHAKTEGTIGAGLDEWLPTHDVDDSTRETNETYIRLYIKPALGGRTYKSVTPRVLERFYAELARCRDRCDGKPRIDHRTDKPHECRVIKHRYPPGRRPAGGRRDHDCKTAGCTVVECQPHECQPLAPATILKIHFILSAFFAACVRWDWLASNPADVAKKPRQPTPQPKPPTTEQAAKIVNAAWEQGLMWGTLVWLVMVTGMRRAEVLALTWLDVDLSAGYLTIDRDSSKTHRMRRIALDSATVEVLKEYRTQCEASVRELGEVLSDSAYMFSYSPTCDRRCSPDAVTSRYRRMCEALGIQSNLHALRHYAATELLTAGVDLRTVAGRLGHAGGGVTTLRVYAAWRDDSDREAAKVLGARFSRPKSST